MSVKVEIKNNLTYVFVSGNITSANAGKFEEAIADRPGDTDGIIIDATELEFISSAGLRVILGAKKRCASKPFKVIGVNNDVKSVFDVTGFSEIMDIEGSVRQINIDGCELIGAGACGECYRVDDETIVKLYYSHVDNEEIENEKAFAKKAFVMGVPTAISYDIVECNGRTGVMYELIKSKTLGELVREDYANVDKYVDMYVDTCKKVGSIVTDDPEIRDFKTSNYADIDNLTTISDREREYLCKFLDMVPNGNHCIHGDLNLNNIMVENNECLLIDMGELGHGTPLFDISRIVFSMEYANTAPGEFNSFYKMSSEQVTEIFNKFMLKYFGEPFEEAAKKDDSLKWLYPLAWFRSIMSMLKSDRWSKEKRDMAKDLLDNHLIPFVDEQTK